MFFFNVLFCADSVIVLRRNLTESRLIDCFFEQMQALPQFGIYMPVRVCADCFNDRSR